MAEAAVMLELPPGTVASRLRCAREDFRTPAERVRRRVERIAPSRSEIVPPLARQVAR